MAAHVVRVNGRTTGVPPCTCGARTRRPPAAPRPAPAERVSLTPAERARLATPREEVLRTQREFILQKQARHAAWGAAGRAASVRARKGKTRAMRDAERAEIAACYARPPVWEPQT